MLGQNHESLLDLVIRDARGVLEFLGIDLPKDAVTTRPNIRKKADERLTAPADRLLNKT